MRQPPIARILLALALVLSASGALVAAAQAAPRAQQPEQAPAPARIAVVHAAPFNANRDSTVVTVVASVFGQDVLLTNSLKYRDVFPYVTVPAGTYTVKVYAGALSLPIPGSATPVLTKTGISLAPGTDYTAVAIGKNDAGYPLDLLLLDDTTPDPAAGTGKVRVVHAAPFGSAGATGTGVDVVTDTGGNLNINNLTYPTSTPFVALPSGAAFNLKVVATGTSTTIIDLDPFTLTQGDRVTVVAIGGVSGYPAEVLFLPFVERGPSQVRLVHAAPFATGAATVTVTLNDQVLTNSLDFRDVTLYRPVQPGLYTVKVYAGTAASGTPVLTLPLAVPDGQRLTVVAMGVAPGDATYPLKLRVLVDDASPAGSASARLRVLHAAPFAATVPGTAVDVRAQGGSAVPGLSGITYDELRAGVIVPSGTPLDLKVVPAGQPSGSPIIDPAALTLDAGGSYTLIAVGGRNGQPANLLVLNDQAETMMVYLPLIAK